jgi:predicted thioesterase
VALVEEATVAAVAPALGSAETTVGIRVELDHLAPTLVGATVHASAELVTVEGRRLEFAVAVFQGETQVAVGRVLRVVVDRERFLGRAG